MVKKSFTCPVCGERQKFKHLILLSNRSAWHCHKCHTLLQPEALPENAIGIGFFSVVVPSFFSRYVLDFDFFKTMITGLLSGLFVYVLSLVYFFKTVKLKQK